MGLEVEIGAIALDAAEIAAAGRFKLKFGWQISNGGGAQLDAQSLLDLMPSTVDEHNIYSLHHLVFAMFQQPLVKGHCFARLLIRRKSLGGAFKSPATHIMQFIWFAHQFREDLR